MCIGERRQNRARVMFLVTLETRKKCSRLAQFSFAVPHGRSLRWPFPRRMCSSQMPPDYLHARFTVQPHGSIRLYGRRDLPLVEARMVASATAELREDSSMVRGGISRAHQKETLSPRTVCVSRLAEVSVVLVAR